MDLKSAKEMLKNIYLAIFLFAAFACQADPRIITDVDGSSNLKPDAEQSVVAKELVTLIENFHYKKVKIDDAFSSSVLDRYLKALDPGKSYFFKSDIAEFEKFRNSLDDDLRSGDLSAPFYIFNVYQKRYTDRVNFALSKVNANYNYVTNEKYTYDREKLPWLTDANEADELWTKRVKYELLNLKLSSADAEKNKKTLKERYTSLLSQSSKFNNQDVFQTIMNAFTETVDPHTNYFVPNRAQEFNEDLARTFEGIGARLQLENEVVKVAEIIPGGPAFKARTLGIDDRIIAVAQGKDGEFVDVVGWRIDVTVTKIKGPKGTIVRLKVIPAGQELSAQPRIVELVRDKVVLEEQSAKKTIKSVTTNGITYKVGIINIPAFYADFKAMQAGDPNYKSTTRDVRLLLDTLKKQKVDAVIIDLRSNGGGSLPEAISLTGLFIKTGPVVQVRDARNKVEIESDENPSIAWNGPLGVIVDRFSASASEIFAGAIQDYGRGIITGTQTYGKGTVQQGIDMARVIGPVNTAMLTARNIKDGKSDKAVSRTGADAPRFGQINLTMAKFYRINGSSTQHKGVMPDVEFPMVFPADDFGESSEPTALPWDTIEPSDYTRLGNLDPIKRQLISLHDTRMKTSLDYKNLQEDIREFKKRAGETSVTLNETQLKKERDEKEASNLARDNARRASQGLPPLKKGEVKPKNDFDFLRDESLKIMGDFMQIKQ